MCTQRFCIVRNYEKHEADDPDGLVKDREKSLIGRAKNRQGPEDRYIDVLLEGYWIIPEEDKKLLDKVKRNGTEKKVS